MGYTVEGATGLYNNILNICVLGLEAEILMSHTSDQKEWFIYEEIATCRACSYLETFQRYLVSIKDLENGAQVYKGNYKIFYEREKEKLDFWKRVVKLDLELRTMLSFRIIEWTKRTLKRLRLYDHTLRQLQVNDAITNPSS